MAITPQHKAFIDTMGPIENRLIMEVLSACKRAEQHGEYHVVLTIRQAEALTEFFHWSGWPDYEVSIGFDNQLVPGDWLNPEEEEE